MQLTPMQKLQAFQLRFYQGTQWEPKAGDYYTTTRADFEVYQVVSVDGSLIETTYTEGNSNSSYWEKKGFLTEGFGPNRMWVPDWIFELGEGDASA